MHIEKPGQHLDHMLKQTRSHHVQLSMMADMKANMMLTVASLVIPLSVRYLTLPPYQWGAASLIAFCAITVALAAAAAMPKILPGPGTGPRARPGETAFNSLFFGDFVQLTYPEYEAVMEEMLNDTDLVYEAQVREIYLLGQYLAEKKYRYLQLSYMTFISGLIISGIILIASGLMH